MRSRVRSIDRLLANESTTLYTKDEEHAIATKMRAAYARADSLSGDTSEDAVAMAELAKEEAIAERDKLVKSILPWIMVVSSRKGDSRNTTEDFFSVGAMAAIRKTPCFDPTYNAKYSTYICKWVIQSHQRYFQMYGYMIRTPANVIQTRIGLAAGRIGLDDLTKQQADRVADGERASAVFGDSAEEGGSWLEDVYACAAPDDDDNDDIDRKALRELVDAIPILHAPRVVILRYGLDGDEPKTLHEVSQVIGRSRQRVNQIETKALKWLRERSDLFQTA